jgi:hypothetical protein
MDRGVPSVARRLDRGIGLDRDFDELRLSKRSVRGARVRRDNCRCHNRKHQSTADLYRWHPNSRFMPPLQNTSPAQKGSIAMTGIDHTNPLGLQSTIN